MRLKKKISVLKCKPGMHLAEDIIHCGLKLVSRNTILNSYIINKLISIGEYSVFVYVPESENYLNKYHDIIESFQKDYEMNINIIKKIIDELTTTNKVNTNDVLKIAESIIGYLNEPNIIIECLNSLKKTDKYTYIHSVNVAIYSMLIGKWMGLSLESIKDIIQAGLLHDIGKTKITNEILNKPGKLTNEEFDEVKKHTIFGYHLINKYNNIDKNIKNAILMHHERLDGSGYPFGRTEKDITLNAKIVSVADTFDAMTSNRVYKRGTIPFKAFQMFVTEGLKQYDIPIVFTLLENLTPYYIGMRAILEDGRRGEIMYIPPNDILNPIIKINDEFIDLSKERNISIVNICSYVE
jgi:putative nucleotidyltransferase with HDIG domain